MSKIKVTCGHCGQNMEAHHCPAPVNVLDTLDRANDLANRIFEKFSGVSRPKGYRFDRSGDNREMAAWRAARDVMILTGGIDPQEAANIIQRD